MTRQKCGDSIGLSSRQDRNPPSAGSSFRGHTAGQESRRNSSNSPQISARSQEDSTSSMKKKKGSGKTKKTPFQRGVSVESLDHGKAPLERRGSLPSEKTLNSSPNSPKPGKKSTKALLREEKRERQRQMEKERQMLLVDQRFVVQSSIPATDSSPASPVKASITRDLPSRKLERTSSVSSVTSSSSDHQHSTDPGKCRHLNCHLVDSILAAAASISPSGSDSRPASSNESPSARKSDCSFLSKEVLRSPISVQRSPEKPVSPKNSTRCLSLKLCSDLEGDLQSGSHRGYVSPQAHLPLLATTQVENVERGPSSPHSLASDLAEKMYGPAEDAPAKPPSSLSSSSKHFPASTKPRELRIMQVSPFICHPKSTTAETPPSPVKNAWFSKPTTTIPSKKC